MSDHQILELARRLAQTSDEAQLAVLQEQTVEAVLLAPPAILHDAVVRLDEELGMQLPVWLRLLIWRLIVLQRPEVPALLLEAASQLELYGPDWDEEAGRLRTLATEEGR